MIRKVIVNKNAAVLKEYADRISTLQTYMWTNSPDAWYAIEHAYDYVLCSDIEKVLTPDEFKRAYYLFGRILVNESNLVKGTYDAKANNGVTKRAVIMEHLKILPVCTSRDQFIDTLSFVRKLVEDGRPLDLIISAAELDKMWEFITKKEGE